MALSSAFAFLILHSQQSKLDNIEKTVQEAMKSKSYDTLVLVKANEDIFKLAEGEELKTGSDFLRAAKSISYLRMRFDTARVKHELTLAALAQGEEGARKAIKETWDSLLLSTGRPQRIGFLKFPGQPRYEVAPAPKSVFAVIDDPDKAREAAKSATSDAEVTKICDEDQKDRQQDWSKLTAKQMNELAARDKQRLNSILKLLDDGRVVTAEDFDHASLVLQHGSYWGDYSLAHELSICSLLLGNTKAAWLAAATYDRMLESGGHHQRFGTQYSSDGNGPFKFDPCDTAGIGDTIRKAMHCPTLEQAKNRKWD